MYIVERFLTFRRLSYRNENSAFPNTILMTFKGTKVMKMPLQVTTSGFG